jgi:hypothetical protein
MNNDKVREAIEEILELLANWGNHRKSRESVGTIAHNLLAALRSAPGARCYDCGLPYDDDGFCDVVVPHDVWAKISPTGDEGGLLCPTCIVRAAHRAGVKCRAMWCSGPFDDCEPAGDEAAERPEGGDDAQRLRLRKLVDSFHCDDLDLCETWNIEEREQFTERLVNEFKAERDELAKKLEEARKALEAVVDCRGTIVDATAIAFTTLARLGEPETPERSTQ